MVKKPSQAKQGRKASTPENPTNSSFPNINNPAQCILCEVRLENPDAIGGTIEIPLISNLQFFLSPSYSARRSQLFH